MNTKLKKKLFSFLLTEAAKDSQQQQMLNGPLSMATQMSQYVTLIVLKFLTSTPNRPSQASQSSCRV